MSRLGQPPKATASDWAKSALEVIAERGVGGLSVELVASRLGVTKGSFYGYYASRRELVVAALDLWEINNEVHMITPLRRIHDPATRFRAMTYGALLQNDSLQRRASRSEVSVVELSLLNDRNDPMVADAVSRVIRRRIDLLKECLLELGHDTSRADRMAVSAYGLSLGLEALRRINPDLPLQIDRAFLDIVLIPYLELNE